MGPRKFLVPIVCWVALAAGMQMGCADRLLLFPSTGPLASVGRRDVIASEAGAIETFVATATAAPPRAYVVAFTGNAGRAEVELSIALELFEGQPVEVIAVNPPGYGRSDGPASLDALGPAALAAYDATAARAAGKPVLVYGNSMGSTVALHVGARREVAGLILRNPPPLRALILGRHGWWNLWLLAVPVALAVPSDLDAIDNARNAHAAAVFLRATRDEIVPASYQESVLEAYAGRKVDLSYDGGHNDPLGSAHERARSAVADLLAR